MWIWNKSQSFKRYKTKIYIKWDGYFKNDLSVEIINNNLFKNHINILDHKSLKNLKNKFDLVLQMLF